MQKLEGKNIQADQTYRPLFMYYVLFNINDGIYDLCFIKSRN